MLVEENHENTKLHNKGYKEVLFTECKHWERFVEFTIELSLHNEANILTNISKRYSFYNTYRS